ncbi:hypothetical protein BJY04DRAFT_42311 [Aspergillus karnatakaensis]|uniref:uncharacterized protein n=1 Tax=Aspergillus karnatakaensis TaxID=1810916 RepID=UPI003CCDA64B
MDTPIRAVVRATVTDIPGHPQQRFDTLAKAFCSQVLNRGFYPTLQVSSYDHAHIPADFDSDTPVTRWFIIDLNVRQELTRDEVMGIPHSVYLAGYENHEWRFTPRNDWMQQAVKRASWYTWGGRREQRRVAEMREKDTADLLSGPAES